MKISEVKKQGFKVYVKHRRRYVTFDTYTGAKTEHFCRVEERPAGADINKGGFTEVELVDVNGQSFKGVSVCSNRDTFSRKLGVKVAMGRALKEVADAASEHAQLPLFAEAQ